MSVDNNTFLNTNFDLEDDFVDLVEDQDLLASDPVEVIVARVLFALLVSVSLVINLLLALAVGRRWKTVHLIYILAASMALPDLVFYSKLVAELVNSWERSVPPWTTSGNNLMFTLILPIRWIMLIFRLGLRLMAIFHPLSAHFLL